MAEMQVETFECTETLESGEPESAAEVSKLVAELGLAGQIHRESAQDGCTFPYREMSKLELLVYGTLLQTHEPIERYRAGPIPLRVLQVAAGVRTSGACKRLEVWHSCDPAQKDPLLVGLVEVDGQNWNIRQHLLARWGQELVPFASLIDPALAAVKGELTLRLKQISAAVAADLSAVAGLDAHTASSLKLDVSYYGLRQ